MLPLRREKIRQMTFNEKTLDFSLLDFWRWSVSDILSNATSRTIHHRISLLQTCD